MSRRRSTPEPLGTLSNGQEAALRSMDLITAADLSKILVGLDPWSRLGIAGVALAQSLMAGAEQGATSWCLMAEGVPAGAMVVRNAWLRGPYLAHLSVLPAYQRHGLGQLAMAAWEAQARRGGARNLWLCASSFNTQALQFYRSAGFVAVGTLDSLIVEGLDELLMRKRLA